jgi:hypothetical protein
LELTAIDQQRLRGAAGRSVRRPGERRGNGRVLDAQLMHDSDVQPGAIALSEETPTLIGDETDEFRLS